MHRRAVRLVFSRTYVCVCRQEAVQVVVRSMLTDQYNRQHATVPTLWFLCCKM